MVSIGREKQTSYPELASTFKAAWVKLMLPWMAEYTGNLCDKYPFVDGNLMKTCTWALADFVGTLDKADRWLTDEEVTRAQDSGYLFLTCYQELARRALVRGVCLYKIVPKFHYLCHVLDRLPEKANPRFFTCFMDEDYMWAFLV